jgi:hypothetical protein
MFSNKLFSIALGFAFSFSNLCKNNIKKMKEGNEIKSMNEKKKKKKLYPNSIEQLSRMKKSLSPLSFFLIEEFNCNCCIQ